MKEKTRIDYLDGIRGLAALAVTVLHAWEMWGVAMLAESGASLNDFERIAYAFWSYGLKWGIFAVEVFIVLSGYSLMLGVVRSDDAHPKGGLMGYFKRRIQRIWPPYYWALAISLFLIVFVPGMNQIQIRYWDHAIKFLNEPGAIFSHLVFLQNWDGLWFNAINPPLWTIAVEEQIYILFPLLLLPLYRPLGTRAMVLFAIVFSVTLAALFPDTFMVTHIWYLALFALGAAAASINYSKRGFESALRTRIPWLATGIVVMFAWFAIKIVSEMGIVPIFHSGNTYFEDIWLGVGVAALLVHWTEWSKSGKPAPRISFLRFFNTKWVLTLGMFTYSLYLMHAPILALTTQIGSMFGLRGDPLGYVFIVIIGIPIAIAGSYLFHVVFERPFLPQFAHNERGVGIVRWMHEARLRFAGVRA